MQIEATTKTRSDEIIVAAVRRGDREAYCELIERHEQLVYGIAWSRLGDPHLAEEAAQETFIRGFRFLKFLNHGSRFPAWIASIARRTSVNLGLRHRRELKKRERWALEQTPTDPAVETSGTQYTPEMLRESLARLTASHRECLILFYLEGKSGAECAAALGISETTFRVRLHRARSVLRHELERKLEHSLRQLRPAKSIAPAVMGVVLVTNSAGAAPAGGSAALGAAGKALGSKWFSVAWLPALTSLPGLLLAWGLGFVERANLRERDGFRARLHRKQMRGFLWAYPVLLIAMTLLNGWTAAAWGQYGRHAFLGVLFAPVLFVTARSLAICRAPGHLMMCGVVLLFAVSAVNSIFGWLPPGYEQAPFIAALLLLTLWVAKRPARMDYNLFLRARHGMLSGAQTTSSLPKETDLSRTELMSFARFLGTRYLVHRFKWRGTSLDLALSPAGKHLLANISLLFLPFSRRRSFISLNTDGTVLAKCDDDDAQTLRDLNPASESRIDELERHVSSAVTRAWQAFREHRVSDAEKVLGNVPESEIFRVPLRQAQSTRWLRLALIVPAITLFVLSFGMFGIRERLSGLRPVTMTESQVREFLATMEPVEKQNRFRPDSPDVALFSFLALPETNLFTPEALQIMRRAAWGQRESTSEPSIENQRSALVHSHTARNAVLGGWLSWDDMAVVPADIAALHRSDAEATRKSIMAEILSTRESWSWVQEQRVEVTRLSSFGYSRLRWLQRLDCLDLVEREKLLSEIASVQVQSGEPLPGQPRVHGWRTVRGLFFTPGWPALEDTYYAVAALEILGGLDRIDREVCIAGILRVHAGRGFFVSPDSGGYNEYKIRGDARDTLAAYETLRILGALNRVKDLPEWKFRPSRVGVASGQFTWNDVEAWVCQQRLERALGEIASNPGASYRSLLEP